MSLDIQNTSAETEIGQAVERYRNGDPEAWTEIFQNVQPTMHAWLLRRGLSAQDRLDLIQDILLHAQQKLPTLRNPDAFVAWLRSITRNRATNFLGRRRAVVNLDEDLVDEGLLDNTTPPDIVVREETRRLVRGLVRGMKKMDREVLYGFYFNEHSLLELAAALNVPLGTIKRRLYDARKHLKELMCDDDYL